MFLPSKENLPFGRPIKPGDQVEHRGLAGPVGTDEPQKLAALEGHVESRERLEVRRKNG